jgi:two-component system cell cycle sensor histidine kinase/response regulator CckA
LQAATAQGARPGATVDQFREGVTRAAAILSTGIGILGLIGSVTGATIFASWLPGLHWMRVPAALVLIASGFGLGFSLSPAPLWRSARIALGLFVCTGAALIAAASLTGLNAGLLDRAPGRVPFEVAAAYLAAGGAILASTRRWGRVDPAEFLGFACAAIGTLGLLGYAYGAPSLVGADATSAAALPTYAGLLLLGVGFMSLRAEYRIPRLITDPGLAGQVARLILPAALLIVPVGGWLEVIGEAAGLFGPGLGNALLVELDIIVLFTIGVMATTGALRLEERRRATEQALRESEERFRTALDTLPDPVAIHPAIRDDTGRIVDFGITYVNAATGRLNRLTAEHQVGGRLLDLFPALRGSELFDSFVTVVETGEPFSREVVTFDDPNAAGGPIRAVVDIRAARLGDGYVVASRDVTARALAEQALRASEHDLAEAQRIARVGSWSWDPQGRVAVWSSEVYRILGQEPDSAATTFAGMPATFGQAGVARLADLDALGLRTGQPYLLDLEVLRPDGSRRWAAVQAEFERDGSGAVDRVRGTLLDITDRVMAEVERSRLVSAIEQSADAVVIGELGGPVEYVNAAFERLYGHPRAEVLGRDLGMLSSGRHSPEFWHDVRDRVRAGGTWTGPIVNQRRDGTLVEVNQAVSAFLDTSGLPTGYVASHRDVTHQRELEAQLRQAHKMEAVGQLAGGIAHDFNNMLTAIRGYTELVRMNLPPDDTQDRDDLDQVILTADKAAELTRQLLAYSRKQVLAPRLVAPNDLVAGMAPLLKRLLGDHIRIVVRTTPGIGVIRVDPAQFEQVLLNLAVNARDAMPEGGELAIETSRVELDETYANGHPGTAAGPHVVLAVSDTGMGMDAETQAHAFEPFFTTKPAGQGTGMGLATVYGIVQQSSGSIFLDSEPGRGSTFKLAFPWAGDELQPTTAAPPAPSVPEGIETILLVEDAPAVRAFARRTLADLGYHVIEAGSSAEALARSAAHAGVIHLLVTDVVMPGIGGPDLALRLAADRPGLPTLFVSGFTEHAAIRHGVEGGAYLAKPFSAAALGRAVRTALAQAA